MSSKTSGSLDPAKQRFIRVLERVIDALVLDDNRSRQARRRTLYATLTRELGADGCIETLTSIHAILLRDSERDPAYWKQRQEIERTLRWVKNSKIVARFTYDVVFLEEAEVICPHNRLRRDCQQLRDKAIHLEEIQRSLRRKTIPLPQERKKDLQRREQTLLQFFNKHGVKRPKENHFCYEHRTIFPKRSDIEADAARVGRPVDRATRALLRQVGTYLLGRGWSRIRAAALLDDIIHSCFGAANLSSVRRVWQRLDSKSPQ